MKKGDRPLSWRSWNPHPQIFFSAGADGIFYSIAFPKGGAQCVSRFSAKKPDSKGRGPHPAGACVRTRRNAKKHCAGNLPARRVSFLKAFLNPAFSIDPPNESMVSSNRRPALRARSPIFFAQKLPHAQHFVPKPGIVCGAAALSAARLCRAHVEPMPAKRGFLFASAQKDSIPAGLLCHGLHCKPDRLLRKDRS